jgi:hypothetical protein
MRERINLFYQYAWNAPSGALTYTAHLVKSLFLLGFEPVVWKISATAQEPTESFGIKQNTCTLEQSLLMTKNQRCLITFFEWKECRDVLWPLLECRVPIIIHDPAEFHDDLIEVLVANRVKVISIRRVNHETLLSRHVNSVFVPHMFVPSKNVKIGVKLFGALCLARIVFRKHTGMIIEANKLIEDPKKQCHLCGYVVRPYEFHELRKKHPDWRRWYHGQFPVEFGVATNMFARANYAVDLTKITGDGGGTQYTFFEAWNAGVPLVLNKGWEVSDTDDVKDGRNCIMVKDAYELRDVLMTPPEKFSHIVATATEDLKRFSFHNAKTLAEL